MTEPSQYFKGRTVQEQMNDVIGYVDARSTEVASDVAAAKASEVLEPAEAAKDAAQAAQEAAEDAQTAAETAKAGAEAARDTTLAALPQVQSDIDALEGRMDTVELKVTTAEGNIITIQGQITALQTADGQNVKINRINDYAIGLTGNQTKNGILTLNPINRYPFVIKNTEDTINSSPNSNQYSYITFTDNSDNRGAIVGRLHTTGGSSEFGFEITGENNYRASIGLRVNSDGKGYLRLTKPNGTFVDIATW